MVHRVLQLRTPQPETPGLCHPGWLGGDTWSPEVVGEEKKKQNFKAAAAENNTRFVTNRMGCSVIRRKCIRWYLVEEI